MIYATHVMNSLCIDIFLMFPPLFPLGIFYFIKTVVDFSLLKEGCKQRITAHRTGQPDHPTNPATASVGDIYIYSILDNY